MLLLLVLFFALAPSPKKKKNTICAAENNEKRKDKGKKMWMGTYVVVNLTHANADSEAKVCCGPLN